MVLKVLIVLKVMKVPKVLMVLKVITGPKVLMILKVMTGPKVLMVLKVPKVCMYKSEEFLSKMYRNWKPYFVCYTYRKYDYNYSPLICFAPSSKLARN